MRTPSLTTSASAAACWTLLYVASKVHFALTGRLGVTGGPAVPAECYAAFGPGEVAAAQWGNAAVGLAGVALLLLPLLPARRVNRWVLTVPLAAFSLMALAGAVGMLGRAVLTDAGGATFGAYSAVWAVLIGAATLAHHRGRARVAGTPGTGRVRSRDANALSGG
jgi:hypothetical protein